MKAPAVRAVFGSPFEYNRAVVPVPAFPGHSVRFLRGVISDNTQPDKNREQIGRAESPQFPGSGDIPVQFQCPSVCHLHSASRDGFLLPVYPDLAAVNLILKFQTFDRTKQAALKQCENLPQPLGMSLQVPNCLIPLPGLCGYFGVRKGFSRTDLIRFRLGFEHLDRNLIGITCGMLPGSWHKTVSSPVRPAARAGFSHYTRDTPALQGTSLTARFPSDGSDRQALTWDPAQKLWFFLTFLISSLNMNAENDLSSGGIRMELEYLQEFTVIAKLESFSRAAEELCISQSSLSKHMVVLERELGTPLLIRNSRSVALSQTGAQILPLAAEMQELYDRILELTGQSPRTKAVLRIASIPVMAQYHITGALAKFQREFPDISLEIRECEQGELRELLEKGACDLAFSRREMDPKPDGTLEFMDFCRDNLVALFAADHPLAGRKTVSLRDLQTEPFLFLDQRTGFYNLCQDLCQAAGFPPNVAYTGHRPENIVDLAAQGMGVALLMKRHAEYISNPDVVYPDILPLVESTVCLLRSRLRRPTAAGEVFWAFIRDHRPIQTDSDAE